MHRSLSSTAAVAAGAVSGRLCIVFPGQGSQVVGMGKALVKRFPYAKYVLDESEEAIGFKLTALMADGPKVELLLAHRPALLSMLSHVHCRFRSAAAPGSLSFLCDDLLGVGQEDLDLTHNAQPAILSYSLAVAEVFQVHNHKHVSCAHSCPCSWRGP
jgi:malonyl CoA-acyl carrier protein transacylase